MIDNLKFYIDNKIDFEESACKNTDFAFRLKYNPFTDTPEAYPVIGKLQNLEIRITKKKAIIKGSLHKFINCILEEQEHNYNDFDKRDLILVLDEISNQLDIDPQATTITNLEFGLNIEVDKDPQEIIDKRLLLNNFKNHNRDIKFRGKGDFKEFIKYDYSIKIYNKSKQYSQSKHILRVEIKFTQKRKLNSLGVYNLADLKRDEILQNLFNFLMEQFEKLIIIDEYYDRDDIPEKYKTRIGLFTSPSYWVNAAANKPSHIRERLIREYKRLIRKYKLGETKIILQKKLRDKFLVLTKSCIPATL